MQLLLETQQEASHQGVRTGRYLIQRIMSSLIVDKATCRKLLLAYSEMANNIVFHSEPNAHWIGIRFAVDNDHWIITLSDDGGVWEAGKTIQSQEISFDITKQWDESGRGLGIVTSILDDIEYVAGSAQRANQLHMRVKRISPDECRPRVLLLYQSVEKGEQLRSALESSYDVVLYSSYESALEDIETVTPELVLADVTHGGLNGYDLREALLSHPQYDLIPFVYLNNSGSSDISETHYLGIDEYLSIDASTDELLSTLTRVLKTYRLLRRKFGSRVNIQINNGLRDAIHEYSGHAVASVMRSTEIGGGDYIFYKEKEGRSLIMLIDIMGHDEAAKFFTYAHAGYFRGLVESIQTIDLPALMQTISNASFQDDLLKQTTMTFIAACLYEDGSIGLCSAGHPPPLLITEKGCETLPVSGTMPGLLENVEYQEYRWLPKEDERLVLFTDGLVESAEDSVARQELERGVHQQLLETRMYSVHQSVEKVMTWFDLQVGSPPADDTTLILIDG